MAGYSALYVVGGLGGFQGADGVNPIEFLILIGDAHRQWLEAHYFDPRIKPLGRVRRIVPAGPNNLNMLLDASIAFNPERFARCPSLSSVTAAVGELEMLDFDTGESVPQQWNELREEARPIFAKMNIWRADLVAISPLGGSAV